ncbi:AAA family ATPase [Chromobacterium vaccinii]|uniref:AAA family ATPase n=1 Tax=Chromobacterium vaccinii TaxID=1108595 RepID=A0ABV0F8I3_9NEIS|nr:AAA family ATPase [Chromobacterium vaccinii]MCD4500677.1 ATP-binding protein [Chromobacterium vaccinii]
MQKLTVKKFGPLENCSIKVTDFLVLIGPQSSGKSTISKLIFFFLNLRELAIDFTLNELERHDSELQFNNFTKLVRRRFIEFWGPTPNENDLFIRYEFNENTWAEVQLDSERHKYITPRFSQNFIDLIKENFTTLKQAGITAQTTPSLFSTPSVINQERARAHTIEFLKKSFGKTLSFEKELFFIPAGRSLLSTISDQLQYIHPHQLDYPMRQFIERINSTKPFFNKSLEDLIKERHVLEEASVHRKSLIKASTAIKSILNAEYRHDKEGGKLYLGNGKFTKINFASSGQQESIWILLSLFLVLLEKVDAFIFIEEPEAHLFPVAQKGIVSFISYIANSMNCQFMLTSHSPYILSAINNHIYAGQIGKKAPDITSQVIPRDEWLNPLKINGYFVRNGGMEELYDSDLMILKTELVDTASDLVNSEYEKLLTIDSNHQTRK